MNKKTIKISKIKTLILPVAGLGKRLQPLTLYAPKNLLPVAGKTVIEYLLDEALLTDIERIVLVISPNHREQFEEFANSARLKYPRFAFYLREQKDPWGHGHAVHQAADIYGREPIIVRFCDDMLVHETLTLPTLAELYREYGKPIVVLKEVPRHEVVRYGIVETEPLRAAGLHKIKSIVEKPRPEDSPSELAVVGGYVLTPHMLETLSHMVADMRSAPDALLVGDVVRREFESGRDVYGWEHPGVWLDCGNLEGYSYANHFMESRKRQEARR